MTFDAPTAQLLSALLGGALAIAGAIGAQWALDAQRRRAERRGLAGAFAGELAALFSAMQQRRWRDRIDDLIAEETERTGKYQASCSQSATTISAFSMPMPGDSAFSIRHCRDARAPLHLLEDVLEFMEDIAGKFEPHRTATALDHLRAARDLVGEGVRRSTACLEEARRQAR